MKLDLELVRKILLEIEDNETAGGYDGILTIPNSSQDEVFYHARQMEKSGLITATFTEDNNKVFSPRIEPLGHEFLTASKNSKIWDKTKDVFVEKGMGLTIGLATAYMKQLANEYLG